MDNLERIVSHFTDQAITRVFMGWKTLPNGRTVAVLSEPMASPLSFEHDNEADHSGPMQRVCPSCFLIHAARALPGLNKTKRKAMIKEMRAALATFKDENPEATDDILSILKEAEASA